jgi:hypothetical protein
VGGEEGGDLAPTLRAGRHGFASWAR